MRLDDPLVEEFSSYSKWHYDPFQVSDQPEYVRVCRFDADWDKLIEDCKRRANPETWDTTAQFWASSKNNINDSNSSNVRQAKERLAKVGEDPNRQMFDRALVDDVPEFRKLAEFLGFDLDTVAIKFHNQKPGQILHTHVDRFNNPEGHQMTRFVVMMADYRWGQIFQLGNSFFSQWHAGDCMTWDIPNLPHATGNIGLWDRPMLQLTGIKTQRTDKIMRLAPTTNKIALT